MFEIKLVIDLSEQTIKTVEDFNDTLRMLDVAKTGDFEKYMKHAAAKTAEPAEEKPKAEAQPEPAPTAPAAEAPKPEPQPTLTLEQIRAYCAKGKAAGVNIPSIIHEYGHADLLRNVDPKYYGDIKAAVDAQMKA